MFCEFFVKQTIFLSRFAVFCRINKQKEQKTVSDALFRQKIFQKQISPFLLLCPPNPLRHDRLLKDLMPQAAENHFRHRCFCRILSVGRCAVFSRSADARIGKVRYIICRTAEKGCRLTECRITVFFSFVLYKRGLIALREISAKISGYRKMNTTTVTGLPVCLPARRI